MIRTPLLALRRLARIPALVAGLLVAATGAAPAVEQGLGRPQQGLVIVYDVSGSMWSNMPSFGPEPDEAARRYRVVRKFVLGLLGDMNSRQRPHQTALYTFGQHIKGDCRDHGPVVDFGPLNDGDHLKRLRDEIGRMKPVGISPIAASLEDAAAMVDRFDDPNILLVTDGIEECEPTLERQPCPIARALKLKNQRLKIWVVGVNLRESFQKEIACIARETGAEAWMVDGPADVALASGAFQTAMAGPPPPPQFLLRVIGSITPTPAFAAIRQSPRIEVFDAAGGRLAATDAGVIERRLNDGGYTIRLTTGAQVLTQAVTGSAVGGDVEVDWPLNPGEIDADLLNDLGQPMELRADGTVWTLELLALADGRPAPPATIERWSAAKLAVQVPPGTYRLWAVLGADTWRTREPTFTVAPGEIADLHLVTQ